MAKSNYTRNTKGESNIKKALSVLSAAVLIIGGGAGIAQTTGLLDAIEGTSISGPEQPGEANNESEKTYLAEPFDINDPDAVEERAKEIYDTYKKAPMYTEKDVQNQKKAKLQDVINIIYILNGKYENVTFEKGTSDVQKYERLEWLKAFIERLYAANTIEEVNVIAGIDGFNAEDMNFDDYINATDTYATADANKDIYENLANIVKTQVELKKSNAEESELKENANEFYKLYEEVVSNKELEEYVRYGFLQDAGAKAPHFTYYLKQVEFVDKNSQRKVDNRTFDELYDYLELDPDELDCMTKANTTTPFGKKYNASDAKRANAGQTTKNENEVIDKGGKKKGTVTKNDNQTYTTSTIHYTSIPATNPENGNVVPQTTSVKVETSTGGKPVGTTKVVTSTDPALTSTTTTKKATTKYEEPEMVWDDEINASGSYGNAPTKVTSVSSSEEKGTNVNFVASIVAGVSIVGAGLMVIKRKYKDSETLKVNENIKK